MNTLKFDTKNPFSIVHYENKANENSELTELKSTSDRKATTMAMDTYILHNEIIAQHNVKLAKFYDIHVSSSKKMILEGAKNLHGRALIVGIGNACEIPIEELANQFDSITIIDIDRNAMEKCLKKLDEKQREKIEVIHDDLTGLVGDFSQQCEELANSKDFEGFMEYLPSLIDTFVENPCAKSFQFSNYSYVVSSLVLTQLPSLLDLYIEELIIKKYDKSPCYLAQHLPYRISMSSLSIKMNTQHIEKLFEWTSKEGKIYFSDTLTEMQLVRQIDKKIVPISEDCWMVSKSLFQQIESTFIIQKRENWFFYKMPPDDYPGARGSTMKVAAFLLTVKK